MTIGTLLFGIFNWNKIAGAFAENKMASWLSVIWFFFSILLLTESQIIHGVHNISHKVFLALLVGNLTCSVLNLAQLFWKKVKINHIEYWAIAFLCLGYMLVLYASPAPHINVFTILSEAADSLLQGNNPYEATYPDIYHGKYNYTPVPRLLYFPVVVYGTTIAKWLTGDIRWIYVVSFFLGCVGMVMLSNVLKVPGRIRNLIILSWISFPVTFFNLEQAWSEILLLPLFIFLSTFLIKKEWGKAAICLGILCATKQFLIITALFSFLYVFKTDGMKKASVFTVTSACVGVLLMLHFSLWDFGLFVDRTIKVILGFTARDDSLSWVSYFLKEHQYTITSSVSVPIYLVSTVGSLLICIRKNFSYHAILAGQIIVFSMVFLFGKQAFCNYYYFLTFIIVNYILVSPINIEEKK